jgi:hypothetical protein
MSAVRESAANFMEQICLARQQTIPPFMQPEELLTGSYTGPDGSSLPRPILVLQNLFVLVRFEVFTAVTMKNSVFWEVAPCRSCVNRRFNDGTHKIYTAPHPRRRHTSYLFLLPHLLLHLPFIYSEYSSVCIPYSFHSIFCCLGRSKGPPLWSIGQSLWLQLQRFRFDSRRYQIF